MNVREEHCDWSNSAPAYLLGALADDEARGFEAHLRACETCRAQLAELAPALDAIAASVERVEPPAHLRSRIMAEVNSEAELLRAAEPQADVPVQPARPRRPRWRRLQLSPAWAAVAAALFIAVGGLGGLIAAGDRELGPRVVAAQIARDMAPNARGDLVIGPQFATLRLRGMPQPPEGRVYQMWFRLAGRLNPQPTNVLFSVRRDGTATVAVPMRPRDAREVLVTAEPDGGSRRPTSAPILAARLS